MCGISGVLKRKLGMNPLAESEIMGLHRAMAAQKHRGPDDDGVCGFRLDGAYTVETDNALHLLPQRFDGLFGFNRLSIKDLSIHGHQPMLSEDKKVILVFNGEIYNDAELRNKLVGLGYEFKSTTDTEIILDLYLEHGFRKTVEMLNGMFAISIMDLRTGMLYLARDRFGIKPLYYSMNEQYIYFASELKCMVQFVEFKKELDFDAFNARIIFSRPSEKVLLKNVYLVNPGEMISASLNNGAINITKYFDVNSYVRTREKYRSLDEAMEVLDTVLADAVKRQLVSDVKVGCQISGGIDSTLVSYYANRAESNNLNDGVSIIDGRGHEGEEYYIDHVGRQLNLNLHKFQLTEHDFVDNYENLVWYNDAPLYKPFFASFYHLTRGAKQFVTVLMSGEGADELAGGYGRFSAGVLQPFVKKCRGSNNAPGGVDAYSTYAEYAVNKDSTVPGALLLKEYNNANVLLEEQIELFNSFSGSNFAKHLKYESFAKLPESFLRQDKMSMANSIENRVPFADNQVADFLMELPEDMLLRFGSVSPVNLSENPFEWVQGKFILKELCAKKFGSDFAYRRKAIMVFDDKQMLSSNGFKEIFYDSIYPGMKHRDLVDVEAVENWFKNVKTLDNASFNNMWRLIGLETWCQLFLDKEWCR